MSHRANLGAARQEFVQSPDVFSLGGSEVAYDYLAVTKLSRVVLSGMIQRMWAAVRDSGNDFVI